MSNRLKLRVPAGKQKPFCGSCGHRIKAGKANVRLRDGRMICPSCIDRGVLTRRLPCGHIGLPGMTVSSDSADQGNFQCPRCSPHTPALAGYARP